MFQFNTPTTISNDINRMAGIGFDDPTQAQDGVIENVCPVGGILPTVIVAGARLFGKTQIGAVVEFAARDAPRAVLVEIAKQPVGTWLQPDNLGLTDEDTVGFKVNGEAGRMSALERIPYAMRKQMRCTSSGKSINQRANQSEPAAWRASAVALQPVTNIPIGHTEVAQVQ
jgi:hypothetical protein